VTLLDISECTIRYARSQVAVANGASPAEARMAAVEAAVELAQIAESLRRIVRLSRAERVHMAVLMTGRGMSGRQVAEALGVCERTVWRDLGHL
jgi:hypothetical protein